MGKRSDAEIAKELREKIIGFGERSGRKSFYPELRDRLSTLERFRALLDQTNDAILVVDGVVSDANLATCRMLDCTAEQLIGMPVRELSAAIADRIDEARPGQLVAALRTRSGREVPVEATVAFRGTGTARVGVVVARDISERQRSERALKESEERFRAVFEGAAIGIAVIDVAGHLQSTNRALQELLGRPDGELRGQPFLSVIHPADRERLAEHHDELLRGTGAPDTNEVRLARSDGRVVWAQLSASMASVDYASPDYLVVAIQDITARRRAEEALQFLSRASVRLASSLDVGGTLKNITELAVPFLGDLCAIWSCASEAGREHRLRGVLRPASRRPSQRSSSPAARSRASWAPTRWPSFPGSSPTRQGRSWPPPGRPVPPRDHPAAGHPLVDRHPARRGGTNARHAPARHREVAPALRCVRPRDRH